MKTIVVIVIFALVLERNPTFQTPEQMNETNICAKENEFNMYTNLLDVMQQKYKQANCDNKLREMATKCCEIVSNGPAPFIVILMSFLYYPEHEDFLEKKQDANTVARPDEEVVAPPSGKEIVSQQPNGEVVASPSDEEIVPQSPEQPTQKDQFLKAVQSILDVTVDILSIIEESNNYLKEITSVSKQRLVSCLVILTRVELNSKLYELYLKHIENTNAFNNILMDSLFSPLTVEIRNLGMALFFDQIRSMNYNEPETDLNAPQLENEGSHKPANSLHD